MRWLDSITNSVIINLSKCQEMETGKPGTLQSMGLQGVEHNLATEQQRIKKLYAQGWDCRIIW